MLPNPTEYYQNNFDRNELVPVLLGMDFLGPSGVGMILDFSSGLAMNTGDTNPTIYKLSPNHEEHYVIDIVERETKGCSGSDGHAKVVVNSGLCPTSPFHDHQMLELGTATRFDMTACDRQLDEQAEQLSCERIWRVYEASRATLQPAAFQAQASMSGIIAATSPPVNFLSVLFSRRVKHLHPEINQLLNQAARAKAKAKAKPVDLSRVQKMDPRHPRAMPSQWPCIGTNCICGVHLLYTPRAGSTGQHTQCFNPETVARCLRELQ